MAHVESAATASRNVSAAFSYQKECSRATARSKCACASGLHDVAKATRPSCSPGAPSCTCSCALTRATSIRHNAPGTANREATDMWAHGESRLQCAGEHPSCASGRSARRAPLPFVEQFANLIQLLRRGRSGGESCADRESVVEGKRVDIRGRRSILK